MATPTQGYDKVEFIARRSPLYRFTVLRVHKRTATSDSTRARL